MASLTSLLAIAVVALLQSSRVQSHPDNGKADRHCSVHMFGNLSGLEMQYDLKPVHLFRQTNDFKVDDPSRDPPPIGTILVGQEVIVCTKRGVNAHVSLISPKSFDHVRVEVSAAGAGEETTVYLTRHLKVPRPNNDLSHSDE